MADDARPRRSWILLLRTVLLLIGWVAGISGIAYAINAATHPPSAPVTVPVALTETVGYDDVGLQVAGAGIPDGESFGLSRGSAVMVEATGAGRLDQFLSRGDAAIIGFGIFVGAHLLAPLLLDIADGTPFRHRHSRRITVLAAVIAVCGVAAPMVVQWQGVLALQRMGLDQLASADGTPYFETMVAPPLMPLLVAAVVLSVAAAFRAGERLASDVEGLV